MARADGIRESLARSDPFDRHVVSSILAIAAIEASVQARPFIECVGLEAGELRSLCEQLRPGAQVPSGPGPQIDQQEQTLRDILWMNSAEASVLELLISKMIARRSLRPNHLWQDLGLANRGELTALMERHFPRLASRNSQDMKWKKFFYRM
ncbi:MAG: nitrogen fixation protein NifQ, partial [Novosphingobium sp.]|nr:nitrogen fixation protein NifQ [Novosphingobium sp.]